MIGLGTYVSERVQVVVSQFQLLERDELPHPVRPRGGRVRVDVEPAGHGGLCLPGHRPEHSNTATQSHLGLTGQPPAINHAATKVGGRALSVKC